MEKFNGLSIKQKEWLKAILKEKKPITLLSGGTGSGKTTIQMFIIPLLIEMFPGKQGLLVGKTLSALKTNIIDPMQELYGEQYISSMIGDASGGRYVNIFGVKVRCVGANDVRSEGKIRGSTLAWCCGDETALWDENFFDMLMSRLREKGAMGVYTTNPDNPNHWLNRRFRENKNIDILVIDSTIYDNPFLPKDRVDNLERIYAGTELYDRYILGRWASGNGAIYKTFSKDRNVKEKVDREFIDYAIGIDFGESKSSTTFVLLGLWKGGKGITILEDQRINDHGDVQKLQNQFKSFVKRCFENGWRPNTAYYDCAQQTLGKSLKSAVELSDYPIIVRECVKDEIIERIHQEQTLIGAGMFEIRGNCKDSIGAFENALWAEKQEIRLDEVSETNPVDMLDAIEYAFQKWSKNLMMIALYGGNQ